MKEDMGRRSFILSSGAALAAGAVASGNIAAAETAGEKKKMKILGFACSNRKGMTTAKAVQLVLDSAKGADPRIEVELIDLGGLKFSGYSKTPPEDDLIDIIPKLQDPLVGGLVIGSPCFYRGPSSVCKAFIERCAPLREPKMILKDKPVAAVAVGSFKYGGHDLVIKEIQAAMLCFGMIPVGADHPAFQGATLTQTKDDFSGDDIGIDTARKIGVRIAEMALKLGA